MEEKKNEKTETEFDFRTIDTVEKAFQHLGIPVDAVPELSKVPERFREPLMGLYNLMVATEAVNNSENLKLDYTKSDQYKHAPWYDLSSGSVRFGDSDFLWAVACAHYGPRLCSIDSDRSRFIGQAFIKEAEKVLK